MKFVYLLHFERPLPLPGSPQHYLGVTKNVKRRLNDHESGRGSEFSKTAKRLKIRFKFVRVWDGDELFERKLKREGHLSRHCSICNQSSEKPSPPLAGLGQGS